MKVNRRMVKGVELVKIILLMVLNLSGRLKNTLKCGVVMFVTDTADVIVIKYDRLIKL